MELDVTPTFSKISDIFILTSFSYDNGGHYNPGKLEEYRAAFTNSLRKYDYVPLGPSQGGIDYL